MPSDQPPIPREELPPGWGPADCCDKQFTYRHSQPPIELVAARTAADRTHPGLGLSRCWELRYRSFLTDQPIADAIGCVSTRRAAITGLLECMHHIHECVDEPTDIGEIRAVLEQVELSAIVPTEPSSMG